jgi:quercetin dioxygenase-like cupin family protein
MTDSATAVEPRGAAKKEAFHEAAEANVMPFKFEVPNVEIAPGKKIHVKLAGTDNCRASVQVLRNGGDNNLHYHPNMDLIYMVLKGKVRFYGPGDKILGDFSPEEGLLLPENSRYWFKSLGEEEAWLLQIAGYPKGAKASKRIPCEPAKGEYGGVWVGLSEEEHKVRAANNKF